jgi:hypothetical protein
MYLDIGNRQCIDEPTVEQIEFHLRHLPAEAPFVILNADEEQFIQAIPAGDVFRVEWRQEAQHRFMLCPIDRAEQAFQAFRHWDETALNEFPWRRLTVFNDPYCRCMVIGLIALAILVLSLWY